MQIFRSGPERGLDAKATVTMNGVPVTPTVLARLERPEAAPCPDRDRRLAERPLLRAPRAADGRVGFAPFVVRPRRLGEHRVAVVLPTLTWQAYNLRDDDGDGKGDTWYADWKHKTVRLGRPFLNRGVPYHFRRYDLPFLHWLIANGPARRRTSPSPTSRHASERPPALRGGLRPASSSPATTST